MSRVLGWAFWFVSIFGMFLMVAQPGLGLGVDIATPIVWLFLLLFAPFNYTGYYGIVALLFLIYAFFYMMHHDDGLALFIGSLLQLMITIATTNTRIDLGDV